MRNKISLNLIIILILSVTNPIYSQIFIDTVYFYQWGSDNQSVGRDSAYFPSNIFGPPDKEGTKYSPASAESEVVSLGFGGEIIVGNKEHYIIDKEGPDFIIFENVFSNYAETKVFAEPGIVSVSRDGINFVDFPYNVESLEGFAGVNWTNGEADCFDCLVSGGDLFDLSIIGIDSICYIKIKDTSKVVSSLPKSNKYYSPIAVLSGFDLDAVVLLHTINKISGIENELVGENCISETDFGYFLSYDSDLEIKMFDILGNEVKLYDKYRINRTDYAAGLHFIILKKGKKSKILKIFL